MHSRLVRFLVALGICASAAPALAQPDGRASTIRELRGSGASYEVAFDDDPLDALESGTHVSRVKVRALTRQRTLLIRPRVTFVPQMLKSVEQM